MKSGRWSSRKNPTQALQTACYTSASMRHMTVGSPLPSAAVAVIGAGAMGSGIAQIAAQAGHGVAEDVDTAMELGTNYPKGPIAWGAEIGFDVIAAQLRQLDAAFPGGRYRPSPALSLRHSRRAQVGL